MRTLTHLLLAGGVVLTSVAVEVVCDWEKWSIPGLLNRVVTLVFAVFLIASVVVPAEHPLVVLGNAFMTVVLIECVVAIYERWRA
jgi:hypothetical protein